MQKNRYFHKNCAKITITKSLQIPVILYVKNRTNLQLHQVKNIEKPGITPVFYFVGSIFTNLIKTQQNQYNFLFSTIEKQRKLYYV